MTKIVSDRIMNKALDQHRIWRDVCKRGAECVIDATSRREPRTMGGLVGHMCVFCNVCGIGRAAR